MISSGIPFSRATTLLAGMLALTASIVSCGLKGDLYIANPDAGQPQQSVESTAQDPATDGDWVDRLNIEDAAPAAAGIPEGSKTGITPAQSEQEGADQQPLQDAREKADRDSDIPETMDAQSMHYKPDFREQEPASTGEPEVPAPQ